MTSVVRLCALATFFWFVMFSPWTAPRLNFWLVMTMATAVLSAAGLWLQRERLREIYAFTPSHVLIGLVSALLLYAVFWSATSSRRRSSSSRNRRSRGSTAPGRRLPR
jgi:ABC-type transport system involved in cytochrome c biogenesis permease subunit